ncbi:hypothetical protein E4U41_000501 [Claviceps citrina]|nr:hypothetical protein E4U41_000501 [Claviceps citrina]
MGAEPKRASAKQKRSPAKARRSQSRAQNAEASLLSSAASTSSPQKHDTPRTARYSHRLPTDEQRKGNGRVAGRSLIMWNRPRMAEKLLLHIQYECSRHKIALPWDAIAHRLHPGSSGQAVCQHINRLRRELVAEGHLVPPLPQKSGTYCPPEIRGFTRQDVHGSDLETTRPVTFDEKIEDPKLNLPDAANLSEEDFQEVESSSSPEYTDYNEGTLPYSPTPMGGVPESASMESLTLPDTMLSRSGFMSRDRKPSLVSHHGYLLSDDTTELDPTYSQESAHASETSSSLFTDSTSPSQSFARSTMTSELATNAWLMQSQQEFRFAQQAGVLPWYSQLSCTAPHIPSPAVSFERTEHFAPALPSLTSNHYSFYIMDPSARRDSPDCTTSGLAQSQQVPVPHIGGPMEELFPGLNEGDGKIADIG